MARTITREDMVYHSFPIEKDQTVKESDGSLTIYGRATDGSLDSDLQVVDPIWSGPALERWIRTKGNVRVQHSPHLYPAGKGMSVEVDRDGDGAHWVKARIVEPTAIKLVEAGALNDFSIGIARPLVIRDATGKAKGGIVTGNDQTEIAELSIVDRGSNYNSAFTLVKSVDLDTPWTVGDLEALLAKVEAAELTKSDAAKVPDQDNATGKPAKPEADDAQDMAVQDQEDNTDDDEADGKKPEDAQKSYATARAAWIAREPKAGEQDLGPGTAFLAKRAAMAQWEAWDLEGIELGLDGTAAGYQRWLAKRDVDPNVGGGVDRDAMDAQDFVDPEGRRFPIHSPGDVSDAVSSYGRAQPLIPMRKFKARLSAIARRKGPEFVAALPESWSQKNITLTSPNAEGLVPYNLQGQEKPFRHDSINDSDGDGDNDDDEKKTDMAEADLTKAGAGKSCKNCGKTYHADAKTRRCENCGKKLPKAMVTKGAGLTCFKCDASNEAGAKRCANCGKKLPKMLGKAAQALLTKAGIHNWKHGWIWTGAGPNPRLHDHMAAHHAAMSKGKFAEAAGHLHAASMVANSDHKKELADRLMAHAGDIAANAPAKSGKMTAAEKKLHQHLAAAHHAAASPSKFGMEHHLSEATAQRQRLERRHGGATPSAGERSVGSSYDAAQAHADTLHSHRVEQELRAEWAKPKTSTEVRPEAGTYIGNVPSTHGNARPVPEPKRTPTKPEKGLGHDSFGGRSRTAWQGEARRAGVKPRRGAPAHEIAGAVGEHQHRRAMERSLAINPGGLDREGQAAAVDRGVAQFRAEHDAKVGRLGDSTGMGIYPTTAGNQAAHDARQGHHGIGAFSTDPKVRRDALAQARQQARYEGGNTDRPYTPPPARRVPEPAGAIHTPAGSTPLGHGPVRAVPGSQQARDEASRAAASQGEHPGDAAWRKLAGASSRDHAAQIMGGMGLAELKALAGRWNVDTKRNNGKPFPKPMLIDELAGAYGRNSGLRGMRRIKSYNGGIMAKNDTTAVEAEAADAPTYTAQRMHDALCPAYDWAAVTKAYPTLSSIADAIDPATFDLAVLKAADAGDATGAVYAGILHDNADIIAKGHVEAALLADARADLVAKGFGPPPQPEDYQRGYISAGHAAPNAPAMRIPMVPPAVHTISPDDFHRGLITEGHQAESPSDRGDNNPVGSGHSGSANAMFGALGRAAATNTMKALHDHLVDTIPGMCQMADARPVMPADMQANNRPEPVDPAQIAYAGKSADYDDDPAAEEGYASAGLTHDDVALLVKSAVKKAKRATKTIHKRYQRELDTLREELDELGAQPDPTQAPIRGAVTVAKAATTAPTAVPVERISLVEQAQLNKAAADAEYIDYLQKAAALDNPNPSMREQAEAVLEGLLTKAS